MKIALVYNRGSRVGVGERCQRVLMGMPGIEIAQFDLRQIHQGVKGFDLYLRLDDGDYAAPFPPGLHPYAWWVADTHLKHPLNGIIRNAPACDRLFCFQKKGAQDVARTTGQDVVWLPAAMDNVDGPAAFVPHAQRRWDIAFVGTMGKYSLRKVVLELIRKEYPRSFVGTAHYDQLPGIYSQARLVVNYVINQDINMRIFEAMGAGALVVNSCIRDNGFEDLFHPQQDCVVFQDPTTDELKKQIDFFLAQPLEAERIARNGFVLVNGQHTYRHRLVKILEMMGLRIPA